MKMMNDKRAIYVYPNNLVILGQVMQNTKKILRVAALHEQDGVYAWDRMVNDLLSMKTFKIMHT